MATAKLRNRSRTGPMIDGGAGWVTSRGKKAWEQRWESQRRPSLAAADPKAETVVREKGIGKGSGQGQVCGEGLDLPSKPPSHAC